MPKRAINGDFCSICEILYTVSFRVPRVNISPIDLNTQLATTF